MTDRTPAEPTPPEQRDDEWDASHLYVLLYEDIDMCGCGWSDDAYLLLRDLLDHFHDRDERNVVEMIGSTGAAQLVLRRLQQADLIDHGTSVTSSWMTDKGRYARWLMHRHAPGVIDETGFPDCFDYETGRCPDACWVPPADVPPEPPRPTFEEISERIKAEAEAARARMNPIQRALFDEVDAHMESMLLFGTPEPPAVLPEPGALARAAGLDLQAEADAINARLKGASWGDLIADTAQAVMGAPSLFPQIEVPRREVLAKFEAMRPVPRDRPANPLARNIRIGCQRYGAGVWWHGDPHDCPRWARG